MENTVEESLSLASEDSLPILTNHNRTRNVPWGKLAAGFYSVFLLWQLVGNCLYVVRVIECSMDKKLESFRCGNISEFSNSKELELAWYVTRLIQMFFIVIALRKTPSFHGYGPTLGKLKSLPAFWTLVLLLLLGVIRYVILEAWSQSSLSFLLRVSFILSCVLKLAIVGLFNYTQINSIRRRSPTLVLVLVKITLVEILLQSITDFCLGILQLALHADDLNHLQVGNSKNFRTVADLFRKSAECTFHYKVMNFFWQKLFRDNRNILENNHVLLD